MRSIRVIVHAPEERRCRVLADVLANQVGAAWVLVDERRDVMDESADKDQRAQYGLVLDWPRSVEHKHVLRQRNSQASQLMTGKSLLSVGQASCCCVSLRRLSCIVSWPLRTSFSGKTFKKDDVSEPWGVLITLCLPSND